MITFHLSIYFSFTSQSTSGDEEATAMASSVLSRAFRMYIAFHFAFCMHVKIYMASQGKKSVESFRNLCAIEQRITQKSYALLIFV